jgi:nucleotide-binding universal stress UspA family protein
LEEVRRIAAEEDSFIKTGLLEGAPAESIAAVAGEGVFDLIVMGKSNMSRIDRALTGSVTSGVISSVGCDVLVCRKDTAIGWDMVLLPTDGSRCCRTATVSAIEMARLNGSGFAAVSVADVSDNYRAQVPEVLDNIFRELKAVLDEVRRLAEASGVKAKTFVTEGEAYKAITELAKGLGAGIIVMGSHGRSGIKKLLTVSVADQVISHASCPVLVVKT